MAQYNGTSGNDTLTGGPGDDVLDGGAGADAMAGLGGNDVYMVDDAGDIVTEGAGQGTDRINSTIGLSLPADVEDLWLVGSADIDGTGNGLDNVMWGNGGHNVLAGGAGNDTLDGGAGADSLSGGAGDDTLWVDDPGDLVIELAGEGTDTIKSALASFTLPSQVENLLLLPGTAAISGIGNGLDNLLTGNAADNTLGGGDGNDVLDGGAGADTMAGGAGDDRYLVDQAGDAVLESPGEGTDTVTAALSSYQLPDHVENLNLGAAYTTGAYGGTGNALDNVIRGNLGANVIDGGGGNDTLVGGDAGDTLTGGSGNDQFLITTADTGIDTITDLGIGDLITVWGVFFNGQVSVGNGASVGMGEVQVASAGGQTMLSIGVDGTPGADLQIRLEGLYPAANFQAHGFDIVYDTNHAPVSAIALPAQAAQPGSSCSFQLPAGAFTDPDNDALSYRAELIDVDWGPMALPAWLHFDASSGAFSGTPSAADVGDFFVMVTASDALGASVASTFALTVASAAAPVGSQADVTPPSASLSTGGVTMAHGPLTYAVQFNEPVTGLAPDDFVVEQGSVVSLAGDGSQYSLVVAPAPGTEGNLRVSLKTGAAQDAAGNASLGNSAVDMPFDTRVPAVKTFTAQSVPSGIQAGDDLVLIFTEAILRGAGRIELRTAQGTLVESFDVGTSPRVAVNGTLLTIDPTTDLAGGAGYQLVLTEDAVHDLAGNANAAMAGLAFATVVPPNQAPTGSLQLTGTARQGATLVAAPTLADADGMGPLAWQWLADGRAIEGAAGSSFTPGQAQVGKAITVRASWTDGAGHAESVVSLSTAAVANVNDAPTGKVTLSGQADVGAVLTADHDLADADGMGFVAWQWLADGQPIDGATTSTLRVGAAEAGKQIQVAVRYTDAFGTAEQVLSTPTAPVATPSLVDGTILRAGRAMLGGLSLWTWQVAPVDAGRVDDPSSSHRMLADIPLLAPGAAGTTIEVSLPVDVGLAARGPAQADAPVGEVLSAWLPGSMQAAATAWAQALGPGQSALLRWVDLDGGTGLRAVAPSTLVLTGAAAGPAQATAVVIDAQHLPTGALLQLDGIGFAAVLGAAALQSDDGVHRVLGNEAAQVFTLGAGPDDVDGGAGDDVLRTGGGDDRLQGDVGNDVLDGGTGLDHALYAGLRAGMRFSRTATGWSVADTSGREGIDTLTGIERLVFADGRVALDLEGHAGTVAKVIGALFGPSALNDRVLVGLGLAGMDAGAAESELVAAALASDRFAALAGSRSDEDFVKLVYRNVTGVDATAEVVASFVQQLASGTETQASLALMASELALNAQHIDLVGLAASGLEYLPGG